MIRSQQFYEAYLNNHFKIKAKISKHYLTMDKEELKKTLIAMDVNTNEIEFLKTIKIDLVQTFYQSIETLFGFIYVLQNKEAQIDLPNQIVKINIGELHKFIKLFEDFNFTTRFLSENFDNSSNVIPNYQYLFYFVSLVVPSFPSNALEEINAYDNVRGIAFILSEAAKEFNNEVHNSIKHGLRCLIINKINFDFNLPKELEEFKIPKNWRSEMDTILYYSREKGKINSVVVLYPINTMKMIFFIEEATKLLNNMFSHRDSVLNKKSEVEIYFFQFQEFTRNKFLNNSNFKSIRISDPE